MTRATNDDTPALRRVLVAAAAVVLGLVPACGGDDAPADVGPTADLRITYTHDEAGVSFQYGVECGADSAEVTGDSAQAEVDAAAACAALENPEVVDRLLDGPDDQLCTEVYGGPDVARITGTISGQQVDTTVDRRDGCGIADWDELLDPLLPPAIDLGSSTVASG